MLIFLDPLDTHPGGCRFSDRGSLSHAFGAYSYEVVTNSALILTVQINFSVVAFDCPLVIKGVSPHPEQGKPRQK